ncbi:MAG: hypothetical protein IH849_00890 [Acidobacteria bacterium]|nr:hypothetical protein [Acidobacteriota bacterium]
MECYGSTRSARKFLHIEPNRPHQLEGVALFDHAGAHVVVKAHLAVFEIILEVNVGALVAARIGNVGERQVVAPGSPPP